MTHKNFFEEHAADEAQAVLLPSMDPFVDETVIRFSRRFKSGGPSYTYVLLRAASRWYMTGKQHESLTWNQVTDLLLDTATDQASIQIADRWVSIMKVFP